MGASVNKSSARRCFFRDRPPQPPWNRSQLKLAAIDRIAPVSATREGERNVILFSVPEDPIGGMARDIRTRERLSRILKFYHTEAA